MRAKEDKENRETKKESEKAKKADKVQEKLNASGGNRDETTSLA